jgi:hypothetical protein
VEASVAEGSGKAEAMDETEPEREPEAIVRWFAAQSPQIFDGDRDDA